MDGSRPLDQDVAAGASDLGERALACSGLPNRVRGGFLYGELADVLAGPAHRSISRVVSGTPDGTAGSSSRRVQRPLVVHCISASSP